MKSSPLFRTLAVAILVGIIFYFGGQIYRYYDDPLSTTRVYAAKTEESIHTDGWIVREEETFHIGSGILVHPLKEGERVGAGQTLAAAYNSAGALDTVKALEEKKLQLQQLEFALDTYLNPDAALKLDSSITDALLALRGDVSEGDYSGASENLSALKADILKRSHSYSSATEVQAQIDAVRGEIASLESSLSNVTTVEAKRPGTYASVADGYETVLTLDFLKDLTPSALGSVQKESVSADVGKLIYGATWYYATTVSEADAARLEEAGNVTLRFSKGLEQDVAAWVESVSAPENGKCAVVLGATKYMAQMTQLRQLQAEIILDSYTGLRVPANALRLDAEGRSGIYCLVGYNAEFKPADVVYQGDGYTLLRPDKTAEGSSLLRVGDEVIVTSKELYDGKMVYDK